MTSLMNVIGYYFQKNVDISIGMTVDMKTFIKRNILKSISSDFFLFLSSTHHDKMPTPETQRALLTLPGSSLSQSLTRLYCPFATPPDSQWQILHYKSNQIPLLCVSCYHFTIFMVLLAQNVIPVLCFVNQLQVNSVKRKNIFKAVKFGEVSIFVFVSFSAFVWEAWRWSQICSLFALQCNFEESFM